MLFLNKLLEKLVVKTRYGNQDPELNVTGVINNTKQIQTGNLFVCIKGVKEDGHRYIDDAIKNGATSVLVEDLPITLNEKVAYIQVPDTKKASSILLNTYYQNPSAQMRMIGVTGTNGKTTTTNLIDAIMLYHQKKTGVIGTIEIRYGATKVEASLTTPSPFDLQRILFNMKNDGVEVVAMEVSSHALDLGRVHGINYSTAVFTNLTQDHLDYHETMEEYARAKGLLFSSLTNGVAVLNADDPWSAYYQKITPSQVIRYGIKNDAEVRAQNIQMDAMGTSYDLLTFAGNRKIHTKLIGQFNVYNVLAATAAALSEGVPFVTICEAIENVNGVEGRFEAVNEGQSFAVIVDYAHTPDSLENVLQTAKSLTTNKLIAVVGCGGDRDRTKRPIMGNMATNLADYAYFTSDNPRTEDPAQILTDITDSLQKQNYTSIVDRKQAIWQAIESAKNGDCIVIAGKGHEKYQIFGTTKSHFDDKEVAREAIKNKKQAQ
jgi:UDP-N-acetylmuramoyl-L-alanyl-D-glutamate--2,6-diaminopimelate ligase